MSSEHNPLPWDPMASQAPSSSGPEAQFSAALPPSAGGTQDVDGHVHALSNADDVLSPVDIELIRVAYNVIIRDSRCTVCRRANRRLANRGA